MDRRARLAERVVEDARADGRDRGPDASPVGDEVRPLVTARVHRPTAGDRPDVPVAALRLELAVEDPAVVVGPRDERRGAGVAERVSREAEAEVSEVPDRPLDAARRNLARRHQDVAVLPAGDQ